MNYSLGRQTAKECNYYRFGSIGAGRAVECCSFTTIYEKPYILRIIYMVFHIVDANCYMAKE